MKLPSEPKINSTFFEHDGEMLPFRDQQIWLAGMEWYQYQVKPEIAKLEAQIKELEKAIKQAPVATGYEWKER